MKKETLIALIIGTTLSGSIAANQQGNKDKSGNKPKSDQAKCEPMKCGAGKCGSMKKENCTEKDKQYDQSGFKKAVNEKQN